MRADRNFVSTINKIVVLVICDTPEAERSLPKPIPGFFRFGLFKKKNVS
jgi:hypothetical protein